MLALQRSHYHSKVSSPIFTTLVVLALLAFFVIQQCLLRRTFPYRRMLTPLKGASSTAPFSKAALASASKIQTCNPIFTFRGYSPEIAAEGTDLLTAIPTDGQNSGSITPDDLCAEGFDGQSYTDRIQCIWIIFGDQTIGGTALQQTIQTNLEACINYCAFYDGCVSVYFDGAGGFASS